MIVVTNKSIATATTAYMIISEIELGSIDAEVLVTRL